MTTSTKKNIEAECQREEISRWLESERDNIPQVVANALGNYESLLLKLISSEQATRGFLVQLRRSLGIIPSSEKRSSSGNPAKGPKGDLQERLKNSHDEYKRKQKWHKSLAKDNGQKAKNVEARLSTMKEINFSPEEIAEQDKENAEHEARLLLGEGKDPSLESPAEPFMRGASAVVSKIEEVINVPEDKIIGCKIKDRLHDERTRYNFSLNVEEITLHVEKVTIEDAAGEKSIISASTHDFGPARMDVTWEFLSNLSIMTAQYAFPFNRLARMLSVPSKKFTSGALAKYFRYVASRFTPIYFQLFEELSLSDILSGDDTSTRVTEVNRHFGEENQNPPPWEGYSDPDLATESIKLLKTPSLGVILGEKLPFVSNMRNGTGTKKSLQTTVIWGRPDSSDPKSSVVFYRSHLGSFGNLLEIILDAKPANDNQVWIQSDLASINLVSDQKLKDKFSLTYAGCTSHARRPFALHEDEDPVNCDHMLHLFKGLYIYEEGLDIFGRNQTNILAVRGVDSINMWKCIKELAEKMSKKWSKETKLGRGCRYIIRHYDKLTAYTKNPRLSLSNDFSERMLRMEKLIQASSLFRNTLEGRFALDINRTIFQTAIAAGCEVNEYTQFVLKADPDHIQQHPELYTPRSYSKLTSEFSKN